MLVVEDLHWADDALLRFLAHLLEWVDGVPLLVVCTARPDLHERAPGWAGGLPNAHTLSRISIPDHHSAAMSDVTTRTSAGLACYRCLTGA